MSMLDEAAHSGSGDTTATEDLDSVLGGFLGGSRSIHLDESDLTIVPVSSHGFSDSVEVYSHPASF
jgi:hypothetical protein